MPSPAVFFFTRDIVIITSLVETEHTIDDPYDSLRMQRPTHSVCFHTFLDN
jgi:hypothetical protein